MQHSLLSYNSLPSVSRGARVEEEVFKMLAISFLRLPHLSLFCFCLLVSLASFFLFSAFVSTLPSCLYSASSDGTVFVSLLDVPGAITAQERFSVMEMMPDNAVDLEPPVRKAESGWVSGVGSHE